VPQDVIQRALLKNAKLIGRQPLSFTQLRQQISKPCCARRTGRRQADFRI